MHILILSTSDGIGGAAIAARRLMQALAGEGHDARMLVRDRVTDDPRVASVCGHVTDDQGVASVCDTVAAPPRQHIQQSKPLGRIRARLSKALDRARVFVANGFSTERLWLTDAAAFGCSVVEHPWFREADVVHLHWVQQGFLSLGELRRVLQSGKRVVWTMHDLWPATSICHYPAECRCFHTAPDDYGGGCHDCPQLCRPSASDLSAAVFQRKMRLMADAQVTFVACSQWLADEASKSALLKGQAIQVFPNTIDTTLFAPAPALHTPTPAATAQSAPAPAPRPRRQRILFSSANVADERKGVRYLVEACSLLSDLAGSVEVVVMGQGSEAIGAQLPFDVVSVPYTSSQKEIAAAVAGVDVFVTPSLQDNLPNTIMEAMACGVPCVAFRTGGIPEMIDHLQNGYLAAQRDAHDLARGLRMALQRRDEWGRAARQKVLATYAPAVIAARHATLYATR